MKYITISTKVYDPSCHYFFSDDDGGDDDNDSNIMTFDSVWTIVNMHIT